MRSCRTSCITLNNSNTLSVVLVDEAEFGWLSNYTSNYKAIRHIQHVAACSKRKWNSGIHPECGTIHVVFFRCRKSMRKQKSMTKNWRATYQRCFFEKIERYGSNISLMSCVICSPFVVVAIYIATVEATNNTLSGEKPRNKIQHLIRHALT